MLSFVAEGREDGGVDFHLRERCTGASDATDAAAALERMIARLNRGSRGAMTRGLFADAKITTRSRSRRTPPISRRSPALASPFSRVTVQVAVWWQRPTGAWGPMEMWVAGWLFVDEAEGKLKFEADGFERYVYFTDPNDPGRGKFLNVRLHREAL